MGRIIQHFNKRTKTWLIAGILIITSIVNTNAQNLIDPITGSTTQFGQINSDYGPRGITYGSNPHIGIDYQLNEGGKAYAVEGGNIELIQKYYNSSKIKVGNWRYVHMMYGESPDKTWEFSQTGSNEYPPNTNLIYLRSYQNGVLQTDRVLCQQGISGYHLDQETNQTVQLESTVSAGDWIFTSNSDNHLHIDYSPNGNTGWENPLRYIAHRDDHSPTVLLMLQHRHANGNAVQFPDSAVYGNPLIITPMQNVTVDKDFNQMSLFIQAQGKTEEQLTTYDYEHYGLSGIPIYVLNNSSSIMGDYRSGIYPFSTYSSQDYFKYHYNSQQDQQGNTAWNNLEAKHPDGRYTFRARGVDITGNTTDATKTAILDNFRPFICAVSITSDHLLYSAYGTWDPAANIFTWSQNPQMGFASGLMNVHITVHTSEPMSYLTIDFDNSSILSSMPNKEMQPSNQARTEWSITLPYIYLHQAIASGFTGYQQLVFEGEDLAGSTLFAPDFPGSTPGHNFPHRNNDGSWSTGNKSGNDNNHGLYLGTSPTPSVLNASFTGIPLSGSSPLSVQFADLSSGSVQQWEWNFGNGMVWNGKYPPYITYTNNTNQVKTYSVSLKVTDDNGVTDTEYKVNQVMVFPQGNSNMLTASFSFNQQNLGAPSLVEFINTSTGSGLSCYWDFDDGSSSTAFSPTHQFDHPGYYDVTLTVTDGTGATDDAEMMIYVYPQIALGLNVDFSYQQPPVAGDFTHFTDLTTGGPSFARKFWDYGDGTMMEVLGTPVHLYYNPGTYQVRLEVRDYLNNILGACSKQITVIPFALNDLTTDENQIKAKDAWWNDMFGRAVSISHNWAFIGAPYDDVSGSASGSVYVYQLDSDSTWSFRQKIYPQNLSSSDYFGYSVASSGDWMIAGAPGNSKFTNGKAVLFHYDGNSWIEAQSIHCPSSGKFHFGWDLDMDGNLCVISAPNNSKLSPGAAWVYRLQNGTWVLEDCLYDASATMQDRFGMDVAVSGDHIATCINTPAGSDKLWFWSWNGVAWTAVRKINVTEASSVDMDCPFAVMGDTWNNRASVYSYDNGQWGFHAHINPEDGASGNDEFGADVSIKGKYILAGRPGDGSIASHGGSAYLFRRDMYGNWLQRRKLYPSTPEADEHFGWSTALSPNHALCGAYGWKGNRGSAYAYSNITEPCDRMHYWCNFSVYPQEGFLDESGLLEMAGDGCIVRHYAGSSSAYFAREHRLRPGFSAYAGCEAIFRSMDCSLSGYHLKSSCPCSAETMVVRSTDQQCALLLHPNPGNRKVVVNWYSGEAGAAVRILSVSGEMVKSWIKVSKGEGLETDHLAPGIYIIEAIIGNKRCVSRWIRMQD